MNALTRRLGAMWAGLVSMWADTKPEEPTPKTRVLVRESTSSEVRAALEADPAVEVVYDKPIPRSKFWDGLGWGKGGSVQRVRLRGHGYVQGETFDVGINRAKRAIKAIKDKRERRAARTRFIQRLRSSGIKN